MTRELWAVLYENDVIATRATQEKAREALKDYTSRQGLHVVRFVPADEVLTKEHVLATIQARVELHDILAISCMLLEEKNAHERMVLVLSVLKEELANEVSK